MTPPSSSPKGSLEELFRHHLLESEAAAVPPLPHQWEQLDNSLLLAQNAGYRRRLAAYRWAMAASLLLAALAGGGWLRSQYSAQPATLASASPAGTAAVRAAVASVPAAYSTSTTSPSSLASTGMSSSSGLGATGSIFSSSPQALAIEQTPTFFSSLGTGHFGFSPTLGDYAYQAASSSRHRPGRHTVSPARPAASYTPQPDGATDQPLATSTTADYAAPAVPAATGAANDALAANDTQAASQLRARLAQLRLPAGAGLPARLEGDAPTAIHTPRPTRPWQLQVAYASGMFDPNIDFQKAAGDYNANLGPGTVATTRDAAAEYRHNLRPGIGQRLSVWATRRLGIGRWSVRTGFEVAQNTASSASSVGFVGEQVATLNTYVQVQSNRLQGTSYRYRSINIPVEASYASPLRRGFSLYGRMGALFTSLLNIHSEVDGAPEATRSYSTASVGSPYRHLSASVRGGMGMRYEPSNRQWALNLGPVAEAGILSLNIDPTQNFWSQQRPYSIGLEAGIEFSSLLRLKPVPALTPAP